MEYSREKSNRSSPASRSPRHASIGRSSRHPSVDGSTGRIKRALDVGISCAALLVVSPVLLVIALAVRLSDGGSVFYRQKRVGLNGRTFTIYKFRTMSENAEQHLGPIWSVPRDPRCTGIGLSLRRYGLDELPQLWNILRGEMSIVGPRPERPEFTGQFRLEHPNYEKRHAVPGGLTGWAQIHGWRGYTSLEERLRHDLYYVDHWSPGLDLRIMALTLVRGWSERTRNGVPSR